ncbi:MAG: transketolase [Ancalomicrobiaceae bacterium]|nr:transketolase [Ancalomicrobiaceae bacterium]
MNTYDPKGNVARLKGISAELRKSTLTLIHQAGDGHPGPALSIADLVTALYFGEMRVDPNNPKWEDRDRFLLSKGHACTVLYAALAKLGFFSEDLLKGFRSLGSILQGHPVMDKIPGVDMTTGTLGHGLSVGAGMAAAGRLGKKDYRVYVILGDGEINEGIVWEGAQVTANLRLSNLTAFLDLNGFQSGGTTNEVSGIDRIAVAEKFRAFGWNTIDIDGHDYDQILASIAAAKRETDRPTLVVAHTIKGKGVPFMENNNAWHKGVPTKDQLAEAIKALEAA